MSIRSGLDPIRTTSSVSLTGASAGSLRNLSMGWFRIGLTFFGSLDWPGVIGVVSDSDFSLLGRLLPWSMFLSGVPGGPDDSSSATGALVFGLLLLFLRGFGGDRPGPVIVLMVLKVLIK